MKKTEIIAVFTILLLAAFFRFYGVNWDQGQHLHPDERFLTMVATGISWPKNIWEYLDTSTSPLNPHNRGFGFFVYGTFPVFSTKWVAETLGKEDYGNLTLVGRQLSALFDLGTVVLVFAIAKTLISKSKFLISNQTLNPNEPNSKILDIKHSDIGNSLGQLEIRSIRNFPLLAMFFYTCMVLPIQLSHFYTVETYLTFFITLSFFLCVKLLSSSSLPLSPKSQKYVLNGKDLLLLTLIGISFGLSLASKISAILFLPIIIIFLMFKSVQIAGNSIKTKNIFNFLYACPVIRLWRIFGVFLLFTICYLLFTYITLRLAQPYLFLKPNIFDITPNPKVLSNWKQLKSFNDITGSFPPAVQWIKTKPYLFPLKNMVLWGLGLPLGTISISTVIYSIVTLLHCFIVTLKKRVKKQFNNSSNLAIKKSLYNKERLILALITLWIVLLFIYQGGQFAKALRYFFPIYPFLAILASLFITQLIKTAQRKFGLLSKIGLLGYWVIGLLVIIYPLSFTSIYSRFHSRVQASYWIYQNIPPGSTRSVEHWDDGLPMSLPTPGFIHEKYKSVEFPLYGADTKKKWKEMADKLKKTDYIILSSNRLYGSIMTVSEKYPVTYQYYQALFDGSLGFEKIAEFTSRPNIPLPNFQFSIFNFQFSTPHLCLTPPFSHYGAVAKKTQECPLPGITFVDDYADETFTVYDHPKVIIFKKEKEVDYFDLLYNKPSKKESLSQ